MPRKSSSAPSVELPSAVRDAILEAARRTERSVGFIVRRAISAAPRERPPVSPGERAPLALTLDEDDPADTVAKIKALAGKLPLGDAVASAWLATEHRFKAWIEREEGLKKMERADDLDAGLSEAAAPGTGAERLSMLATSDYPKIRALVAAHPNTPAAVREQLAQDREPFVRKAATRT